MKISEHFNVADSDYCVKNQFVRSEHGVNGETGNGGKQDFEFFLSN